MINTSEKIVFHVISRQERGSRNVSRLRKENKIPGNIYGLGQESVAVIADYQGLKNLYQSQGDTGLIYLEVDEDKKQVPVLIDEVDRVKVGDGILHVSFKRVNLNVKIEADVSVELVGETKIDQAVVSLLRSTVLVEALPADLPEKFEVDISSLTEVGQSISLADLEFDKTKISLILGEEEKVEDILLVNVQAVKEEVVEVEEVETEDSEEGDEKSEESKDDDSAEKSKDSEEGGEKAEESKE